MNLIKRAYKYRIDPTAEQRLALARTFGCCRWVYNQALARKTAAYREAGQRLSDARSFGAVAGVERPDGHRLAGRGVVRAPAAESAAPGSGLCQLL